MGTDVNINFGPNSREAALESVLAGSCCGVKRCAKTRALVRATGVGVLSVVNWQSWDRKTKRFRGNSKAAPVPVLCSSGICVVGKEKLQKLPLKELLEMAVSSP